MNRISRGVLAAIALLMLMASARAQAQNYPVRPIRYVVSFSPGGLNDILARIVGQKLAESWGQPVIVDNRPGAGGNLGTELVAKSAADGYTILNISTAQVISQSLYAKLGYSLERDLAPVVLLAYTPLVVTVHNGIAAKGVSDLVTVAKTTKLVNASGGHGTISHLSGEMFKRAVGFNATHVPYKGNGPAIPDMMSGQAHLLLNGVPDLLPAIKSGRVRAIAMAADGRHRLLPDVSTMAEQGYKDFVLGNWVGIVMPTGTPKPIIDKMYGEVARLMKQPDVAEKIAQQGFDSAVASPADFSVRIKKEIALFAKAVKESGARVD